MSASDPITNVAMTRSLPRSSYVDESEFARETEAVLYADWFCVGRTEAICEPGDYLTVDVAGESVVVLRGVDGELAGFYNLCRHRGSRLVPPCADHNLDLPCPSGRFEKAIACPYHAWTYGFDGTFRSAPFLPAARAAAGSFGLHRIGVETWGGFVFVRLAPGESSGSFETQLGGARERTARYPLAELRTGRRMVYEVKANWKVILENYNECYHCGPVHPELCELVPQFRRGGANLDWDAGIPHRDGASTFTMTGRTGRAPFPSLSEDERWRHKGELILPNLMLSLCADHAAAFTLWPRSAARTTVVCDLLFLPAEIARESFDPSDAAELWDLVNQQDWFICEQVQDGMGSRMFSVGYLAPMEQPSADVSAHVARRLGV